MIGKVLDERLIGYYQGSGWVDTHTVTMSNLFNSANFKPLADTPNWFLTGFSGYARILMTDGTYRFTDKIGLWFANSDSFAPEVSNIGGGVGQFGGILANTDFKAPISLTMLSTADATLSYDAFFGYDSTLSTFVEHIGATLTFWLMFKFQKIQITE